MLGEPTNEADPTGSTYAFEKSVTKGPPARQKIESKRAGWRFDPGFEPSPMIPSISLLLIEPLLATIRT